MNAPIVLRAGRAEAGIAPRHGGSVTHFQWNEGSQTIPWLRPTSDGARSDGPSDRLACFPLVPFSNRIRNGRFQFGGRAVTLPPNRYVAPHALHGDGWQ